MLLRNKVVLVTGGSRGLGRAIAIRFAEEGALVAFTYLNAVAEAAEIVSQIENKGGSCKGYMSDAGSFTASQSLANQVIKDFGKLDILVNNAGIVQDNLMIRMTEQQWDEVINTNLKSVFNLTRAVVKDIMRAKGGVIINMTSVMGIRGNKGQSNYAASKAGVIGFTKSIAQEVAAHHIRVNAVAPGFIETDMTRGISSNAAEKWINGIPMKRSGRASEVANVCVFLASDLSSYVTGQVLQVDGGMIT